MVENLLFNKKLLMFAILNQNEYMSITLGKIVKIIWFEIVLP